MDSEEILVKKTVCDQIETKSYTLRSVAKFHTRGNILIKRNIKNQKNRWERIKIIFLETIVKNGWKLKRNL